MTIAILGWGSLIWCQGNLAFREPWLTGGPVLPIEFSRISGDGRLTLVIDERHGVDVPTRYAPSTCHTLDEAIVNLKDRERCPTRQPIGFIDLTTGQCNDNARRWHATAFERIRLWAEQKELDAVIWTALGPKFKVRRTETPFTPETALAYVNSLRGDARHNAFEYIENAPPEVVTPFRQLFSTRMILDNRRDGHAQERSQ